MIAVAMGVLSAAKFFEWVLGDEPQKKFFG